jgi:hypothetical protein
MQTLRSTLLIVAMSLSSGLSAPAWGKAATRRLWPLP